MMMSNHLNNQDITTGIERLKDEPSPRREIHGLLVSYKDDQIDDCVHSALRGKQRVHYKCMDVYSNFLAFGTSVGAIYLFRLTTITHESCKLLLVIPCDQGSIEVIKFLPGSLQSSELLVAIGTSRGSLVIFQLTCLDEETVRANELYRAEEFTKSIQESAVGIKLIEYDLDLGSDGFSFSPIHSQCSFCKLYICDQRERLFVLESSSIYPAFRLLYSPKPAHVLSVDESSVNQICVCRSQLLLSTDEKTRIFREQSNELVTIGKKQRKTKGFFGACFFNPNYKPARMRTRPAISSSQQTMYSSTNSLIEMENLLMFIARPKFSLWQVNNRREVMFTHIFDSSIRTLPPSKCIELCNIPMSSIYDDDYEAMQQVLDGDYLEPVANGGANRGEPRSDHFEKLLPIFSMTLGNLLLSYTRNEIFVIDPIGARLIVWYQHDKPITQVCCNENEIFVLSEPNRRQFKIDRLLLLAPTQFILELHRINRFLSLMVFVQTFCEQMKQVMALPLDGPNTITTEGGLLRNIVWSAWRECSHATSCHRSSSLSSTVDGEESNILKSPRGQIDLIKFEAFREIIEVIVDESRQLKQSIENLADSRLLFMVSNENIERLCSEPYASMVSLDINLSNLHTNQVVHFSQEALQKQKSLAKLSQSIMNLNKLKRAATQASLNMDEHSAKSLANSMTDIQQDTAISFNDKRVVVEQLRPKQRLQQQIQRVESKNNVLTLKGIQEEQHKTHVNSGELINGQQEVQLEPTIALSVKKELEQEKIAEPVDVLDGTRCSNCRWPRPRAHLKPMHHSQQIQYNWIQENLLADLDKNVDQIEERAFKHGLWHLILKCYAFRNQWDDYIACCIMLDDVRLLNTDRLVTSKQSEDFILDRVFKQLKLTLHLRGNNNNGEKQSEIHDNSSRAAVSKRHCFRCKHELSSLDVDDSDDERLHTENSYSKLNRDEEDDISFNLVNLFRKYMLRKNADVKWAIGRLLHHPDLLNGSKISTNFYLQVIANQCASIRRTRLKK